MTWGTFGEGGGGSACGGNALNSLPLSQSNLSVWPNDLTPQFGNGTLRLTTRQAYQLHGVLKVGCGTGSGRASGWGSSSSRRRDPAQDCAPKRGSA